MKKYELTDDTIRFIGKTLYRIKALRDFANVKAGDIGGYIENEYNLSHDGNAWAYDNACVSGNVSVYGDAWISGNARVYDNALVSGNARVSGNALVSGNAWIFGNALVSGNARVYDNARVYGDAWIYDNTQVYGSAFVHDNARVYGNACVNGNAHIYANAKITTNKDYTVIQGFGTECRPTTFYRCVDNKVRVKCGCFSGTIDEFREQVKKTREGKIAEEYLEIADLMERHFEKSLDDSDQSYIIF